MNQKKQILSGKWAFVGAEKFIDTQWVDSPNFIDTMSWEFHPQYFATHDVLGEITEKSEKGDEEQFSYSYNYESHLLTIDTAPNNHLSSQDSAEYVDKYEVIQCDSSIIKISILNNRECPPPYFRYVLRAF